MPMKPCIAEDGNGRLIVAFITPEADALLRAGLPRRRDALKVLLGRWGR